MHTGNRNIRPIDYHRGWWRNCVPRHRLIKKLVSLCLRAINQYKEEEEEEEVEEKKERKRERKGSKRCCELFSLFSLSFISFPSFPLYHNAQLV